MDANVKTSLWQQFGAAIDYLDVTMNACPDELWRAPLWQTTDKPAELAQFWYVSYHTLFWLHLYLTGEEEGLLPPPSFSLPDQSEDGPLPEQVYTKAELQAFLDDGRSKCKAVIQSLTDEMSQHHLVFEWGECSFLELLIYNLRHVHGHASQLNMLLGQNGIATPDYVTQVGSDAP